MRAKERISVKHTEKATEMKVTDVAVLRDHVAKIFRSQEGFDLQRLTKKKK